MKAFSTGIPAFDESALETANNFRTLMDAMARPGKIKATSGCSDQIAGLNGSAQIIIETLCDHEVTLWLDSTLDQAEVRQRLSFKCGCGFSESISDADFALFGSMPDPETLDRLKIGDAQYPDRSATAIIQISGWGSGEVFRLSGPGVKEHQSVSIDGLGSKFLEWWHQNNEKFPLGIDAYLTTDTDIMALPRTLKIQEAVSCM